MSPIVLLLLAGCGAPEPTAPPAPAPAPAAVAPVPAVSQGELAALTQRVLAPSPVETRKALERAGVAADVARLVPSRNLVLDGPNVDVVAVRTGVLLADTVLALDTLADPDLLARMKTLQQGLVRMGAGAGLLATVQGLVDRQTNHGITRPELLQALDETVGAAIPEEGLGPDDRTGPLLQSGAWLATTNVAAEAVLQGGKVDAAGTLFRQKAVADWFLGYVRGAAKAKADEQVLKVLEETLTTLSTLSAKESLGEADVRAIRDATGALLGML